MRTFKVHRHIDISGLSGTGIVAEGIEFSDGEVVVRWTTATPSTNIYKNIKECEYIHGHGGATEIIFNEQ